jgi:hypothetical protein
VGLALVSIFAFTSHSTAPIQDPASAEQVCETVQTGSSYTTTCTPADQELNTPTETSPTEPCHTLEDGTVACTASYIEEQEESENKAQSATAKEIIPIAGLRNLFSDIKISNPNRFAAINWMIQTGITNGSDCERPGKNSQVTRRAICKYKESSKINRGAMAEFLRKFSEDNTNYLSYSVSELDKYKASDISKLAFGRRYAIKWMIQNNITVLDNGKYNPANTVNRGSMAEFMFKIANEFSNLDISLDPSLYVDVEKVFIKDKDLQALKINNPNRYYSIMWLTKMHITEGYNDKGVSTYKPWNPVTRGAMAQFLQKLYFVMRTGEPLRNNGVLVAGFYQVDKNHKLTVVNEFWDDKAYSTIKSQAFDFMKSVFPMEASPNYTMFFNFYVTG